jgi:hypothetical protein
MARGADDFKGTIVEEVAILGKGRVTGIPHSDTVITPLFDYCASSVHLARGGLDDLNR